MTTLLTDPKVSADLLALLDGDELSPSRRNLARRALQEARLPTLLIESPSPGVYAIDGHRLECSLVGLEAAFLALSAPGVRAVRADSLSTGLSDPAGSVRHSLRRAATFVEPYSRHLAALVRRVRVIDGWVRYDLRAGRPCDVRCVRVASVACISGE